MKKKSFKKRGTLDSTKLVVIILLLILGVSYVIAKPILDSKARERTIEYITGEMNTRGVLVDSRGLIEVESAEDIRLYPVGREIKLVFGKMLLKYDRDDFYTEDNFRDLMSIGISIYKNPDNSYTLYYNGVEIKEYRK